MGGRNSHWPLAYTAACTTPQAVILSYANAENQLIGVKMSLIRDVDDVQLVHDQSSTTTDASLMRSMTVAQTTSLLCLVTKAESEAETLNTTCDVFRQNTAFLVLYLRANTRSLVIRLLLLSRQSNDYSLQSNRKYINYGVLYRPTAVNLKTCTSTKHYGHRSN